MQKAHADSIMREVMQITQKEKEFEIEIKNLKEQLRVSDAIKQETQSQLIMCQDQLKEMQTIMIEQEKQVSQKQDMLASFQKDNESVQATILSENESLKNQGKQMSQ